MVHTWLEAAIMCSTVSTGVFDSVNPRGGEAKKLNLLIFSEIS